MYRIIEKLCNEHGITIGKLCKETGISSSTFTELKSGRTKELSAKNASKVADYFGVTIDFVMGKNSQKESPAADSDETLMFALYGNDNKDVTPAMLEDVRNFAQFVRERERKKSQ